MKIKTLAGLAIYFWASASVHAQSSPNVSPPVSGGSSVLPGLPVSRSVTMSNDDASPLPLANCLDNRCSGTGAGWVQTEYLLWWLRGDSLPALVTQGTGTSTGKLGQPGTQVLFGDSDANGNARSGGQVTAGWWFDPSQCCGVQASYFMLGGVASRYAGGSSGNPILARPFYNTLTGAPDAEAIAFPGSIAGNVAAASQSGSLLGAELLLRCNLCSGCWGTANYRLDGLAGYRFLYLNESVSVQENLTTTGNTNGVPLGTTIGVGDSFGASNQFHGGEVGLAALLTRGPWSLSLTGKLGLGLTQEYVNINGSTTVTAPGTTPVTMPGGLLALATNIGGHTSNVFSVVPESDFTVGYQISKNWSLTAGYTFLYWSNVVRPGSEIDTHVNPNLIPPVVPGGDAHPAFSFNRSGLWAQGVSLGLLFQF